MSKGKNDEILEDIIYFSLGYVCEKCIQSQLCLPYLMWITIILVVYFVISVCIFGERVHYPTSRNVGWICVGMIAAND